jgi:hypothetical protein
MSIGDRLYPGDGSWSVELYYQRGDNGGQRSKYGDDRLKRSFVVIKEPAGPLYTTAVY